MKGIHLYVALLCPSRLVALLFLFLILHTFLCSALVYTLETLIFQCFDGRVAKSMWMLPCKMSLIMNKSKPVKLLCNMALRLVLYAYHAHIDKRAYLHMRRMFSAS